MGGSGLKQTSIQECEGLSSPYGTIALFLWSPCCDTLWSRLAFTFTINRVVGKHWNIQIMLAVMK